MRLHRVAVRVKCLDSKPSPYSLLSVCILQARTLEWVAISFSNAWKWKVKVKFLSRVRLFETPWTAVRQAPLSMGFSRQEYWSGSSFPSPGDLPNPGIERVCPAFVGNHICLTTFTVGYYRITSSSTETYRTRFNFRKTSQNLLHLHQPEFPPRALPATGVQGRMV